MGHGAWSEITPGDDPEMNCDFVPSHWAIRMYKDTEKEVRAKLLTADTCTDFAPVEPEPVRPDRVGPILPIARGRLTMKSNQRKGA